MDAVAILFELLFPKEILDEAGRCWDEICDDCRLELAETCFGGTLSKFERTNLASKDWPQLNNNERTEILLSMCGTGERIAVEIAKSIDRINEISASARSAHNEHVH